MVLTNVSYENIIKVGGRKKSVPRRYIPRELSNKDKKKQIGDDADAKRL